MTASHTQCSKGDNERFDSIHLMSCMRHHMTTNASSLPVSDQELHVDHLASRSPEYHGYAILVFDCDVIFLRFLVRDRRFGRTSSWQQL